VDGSVHRPVDGAFEAAVTREIPDTSGKTGHEWREE